MKAIALLVTLWLLSGVAAAGLSNDNRASTIGTVSLGPISLVPALLSG